MSASCGTIVSVLYAFIDGELDSIQASAVSVHVDQCPSCEAEIVVARAVKAVVRRAHPAYEVPVGFDQALRRRLQEGQ